MARPSRSDTSAMAVGLMLIALGYPAAVWSSPIEAKEPTRQKIAASGRVVRFPEEGGVAVALRDRGTTQSWTRLERVVGEIEIPEGKEIYATIYGNALPQLETITASAGDALAGVDFRTEVLRDDMLIPLQSLPRLRSLSIGHIYRIDDAGLTRLGTMESLEEITLWGPRIDDRQIAHLRTLPRLRKLSLYMTTITCNGLASLKGLAALEDLDLVVAGLGDDCVPILKGMPQLKRLNLDRTGISKKAYDQLTEALAGRAAIHWSPRIRPTPQTLKPGPGRRTLQFPNDRSLGELFHWTETRGSVGGRKIGEARGAVVVSQGWEIGLTVGGPAYRLDWDVMVPVERKGTPDNPFDLSPLAALDPNPFVAIRFGGCWIDDEQLRHIRHFAGLRVLDLSTQTKLSGSGLSHLENMKALETLRLPGKIGGEGLKHLPNLTSLRQISLPGNITDDDFAHLPKGLALKKLSLPTGIGDQGLAHIADYLSLERLFLGKTQITDAGLVHLGKMSRLANLDLRFTQITDAGLVHLKELKSLQRLNLDVTPVTEEGLTHLQGLTSLKELRIPISSATSRGLQNLTPLKQLQDLRGYYPPRVTDAELASLGRFPNVTYVYLGGSQITDAGLAHLRGMTSLETLLLSKTRVTDAGLGHIAELQSLNNLHLDHTAITDTGLEILSQMKSLNALELQETAITDAGLVHLKTLPGLRSLNLSGTRVTDAGVEHLKEMKALVHLKLRNTAVSKAAAKQLLLFLPRLVEVSH